jgi:FixJ family two-component response regulator
MQNEMKPDVTLYIVDDEEEIRQSLVRQFATACSFRVQAFASGEEFLARANVKRPDCLLLDLRMDDGLSGLQVLEALIAKSSPMVVVFLSGHGDIPTAMHVTKHKGAYDWLVKGMPTSELQDRVVAAMKVAEARTAHYMQRTEVMTRWNALTPRRKEAATHIRKGWKNNLVADEMKIGVRVVERYRSDIFETLWVSNPTELDRLMRDFNIE